MSEEKIITYEGKRKLEEELEYLENEKRREVSDRIKEARSFGDLSENSEYDDAKNEQAKVEKRIFDIKETLVNSKVVKKQGKNSTTVGIGSTVKVKMNGAERTFVIVGKEESDISAGKISLESPVGSALLGKEAGQKVEACGPNNNKIKLEILGLE